LGRAPLRARRAALLSGPGSGGFSPAVAAGSRAVVSPSRAAPETASRWRSCRRTPPGSPRSAAPGCVRAWKVFARTCSWPCPGFLRRRALALFHFGRFGAGLGLFQIGFQRKSLAVVAAAVGRRVETDVFEQRRALEQRYQRRGVFGVALDFQRAGAVAQVGKIGAVGHDLGKLVEHAQHFAAALIEIGEERGFFAQLLEL